MFTTFPKRKKFYYCSATVMGKITSRNKLQNTYGSYVGLNISLFGKVAALHRREWNKWLALKLLFLTADK